MKNKKRFIFILTVVCIGLGITGAVLFLRTVRGADHGGVTCGEWLEMLEDFAGIESAEEWLALEGSPDYDREEYASGEFIALTAMKTLGEGKLEIYLDAEGRMAEEAGLEGDRAYVKLAVEQGLIEEEGLQKHYSRKECRQILETLKGLHFGVFWRDDYAKVSYLDSVTEVFQEDLLQSSRDFTEILVSDRLRDSLKEGSVIVMEQGGVRIAREVSGISPDGTLTLKPAELERVVEELTVSDLEEVTLQDILGCYGLEKNLGAAAGRFRRAASFSAEKDSAGFKLSVETEGEDEQRHLEVKITDNGTGITYTLPITFPVEAEEDYSAEIDIDRFYIGAQADYSLLGGLKYAEAAVDAHATFTGEIKAETEKQIPLCKLAVPLGGGVVVVNVEIQMVLSLEGGIAFQAELPMEASVAYEKGRGLKNVKSEISVENPRVEADCTVGAALRLEPILSILGGINVVDVEFDVGLQADAKAVLRPNQQVCAEIQVSFPVITLSVGKDEDADTILSAVGVSAEWEIIEADNAPVQFGLHYEMLPDSTRQFVEECTYGKPGSQEKAGQEPGPAEGATEFAEYGRYELPIRLYVSLPFEDRGEYYVVKGQVHIPYAVLVSEYEEMSVGDTFQMLDKHFVKGEPVQLADMPQYLEFPEAFEYEYDYYQSLVGEVDSIYCVEDDCTYFINKTYAESLQDRFGELYFVLQKYIACEAYQSGDVFKDLGEQEFVLEKDTRVTSNKEAGQRNMYAWLERIDPSGLSEAEFFARKETERMKEMERICHTVEEYYEDPDLMIADGVNPVLGGTDFFLITFDENGKIKTMEMFSYA